MARLTISAMNETSINNNAGAILVNSNHHNIKMVKRTTIKTDNRFSTLFNIDDTLLQNIVDDMKLNGYDSSQPIIIWKEKDVVIDGHTRLKAVEIAGLSDIPVAYVSFTNADEVLDYMYRLQFNRRNITDRELIDLVATILTNYTKKYGNGSRAEFLSKRFINLSIAKATQIVVVLERSADEELDRIRKGELSIYQAYKNCKTDYNKFDGGLELINAIKNESATNNQQDKAEVKDTNARDEPVSTPKADNIPAGNNSIVKTDIKGMYDNDFIRYDADGSFYIYKPDTESELRIFTLHNEFNTDSVKVKFKDFIEYEILNNADNN